MFCKGFGASKHLESAQTVVLIFFYAAMSHFVDSTAYLMKTNLKALHLGSKNRVACNYPNHNPMVQWFITIFQSFPMIMIETSHNLGLHSPFSDSQGSCFLAFCIPLSPQYVHYSNVHILI